MASKNSGFTQLWILIGLVVTAVALPLASKLVGSNQDNRNRAAGGSICIYDNATRKELCFIPTNTPFPVKNGTPSPTFPPITPTYSIRITPPITITNSTPTPILAPQVCKCDLQTKKFTAGCPSSIAGRICVLPTPTKKHCVSNGGRVSSSSECCSLFAKHVAGGGSICAPDCSKAYGSTGYSCFNDKGLKCEIYINPDCSKTCSYGCTAQ